MTHRRHIAADVEQVAPLLLDNGPALEALAVAAARNGGATVLDVLRHKFDPQGVSLVLLLAESHLSVHTWPEAGECYVDVFTCGTVDPYPILDAIVAALDGQARWYRVGSDIGASTDGH